VLLTALIVNASLLGCDAVYSGRLLLMFQMNLLSPHPLQELEASCAPETSVALYQATRCYTAKVVIVSRGKFESTGTDHLKSLKY
jgi:hypothetical protein